MKKEQAEQELMKVFAIMQTLNDLMQDQEPKMKAGLLNDFESLYNQYNQWREYSRQLETIIYSD